MTEAAVTPAQTRRAVLGAGAAVLLVGEARAADYAKALGAAYGGPADPNAVYALAVREAGRLQARADVLLRGQGLRRGGVGERLRALAADPRWLYADEDAGRDRATAEMNARLAGLRPRLATAFGDLALPQPVVRRPAPENAARGGYREPPVYYVDLRSIRARPAWSLPTVAFHETVPGHALQAGVAGRPRPTGFSEAWAIYAEHWPTTWAPTAAIPAGRSVICTGGCSGWRGSWPTPGRAPWAGAWTRRWRRSATCKVSTPRS